MIDKNRKPLVSVVIPFYSGKSWLCEAVDSVLAQEYDSIEIIVVNDGSGEDVTAFLEKYSSKITYYIKENGGPASARNYGRSRARGEYIAFLDSDDLWTENKLGVQINKMKEQKARWSLTDYEIFGENISGEYRRVYSDGAERFIRNVPPYIATPTVVAERSLLCGNGLKFCEDLRFGQDVVLWEQLINISDALYIPQCLSRVRIRGANAGRRAAVQIHTRVDMYDKCAELIPDYKKTKSPLFRFATALCRFGRIFVKRDSKSGINEYWARVLFIIPYLLYKADRRK